MESYLKPKIAAPRVDSSKRQRKCQEPKVHAGAVRRRQHTRRLQLSWNFRFARRLSK
ncbi:hypothetical protein Esi_0232_0030 [Ectocarpus siliculosus]|uniref:Uncharacterized protein n=1 Tax=Ectocarpus siliculosus TaxID=2880 RepID=D7FSE2_ECTSI|nr:hypothetical protein Esi_0232_0030 [Ectocarpus siliculosus]|eukprot:CBJ31083.1 hypothetical protein Esi_0232_0030 [Ectocarpus siliculosus]